VFSRLPESNARRQRRTGGWVISSVVHGVLIALAVRATGLTAAPAPETKPVPPIYVDPKPAPPNPAPPTPRRYQGASMPSVPRRPDVFIDLGKIPDTIPEIGSMSGIIEPAFDSTRLSMTGQSAGTPNVSDGSPLTESMVEKAVVVVPGTLAPRYPSSMQSAGLEGDVRAQFVVDTLGRVEQGSFQVMQSTHDVFAAAVREAMNRARFKPAEAGGRKVRQLVEQTFTFRITR